jgi:DNA integrity scanning protein DisA with diadenylate cyclase activity
MLFKGKGGVWDAKQSKMLCEFVDGKFETDDKYIIDELISISKRDGSIILQESEYEEYAKELPFVPEAEEEEKPKRAGRPKGVK